MLNYNLLGGGEYVFLIKNIDNRIHDNTYPLFF